MIRPAEPRDLEHLMALVAALASHHGDRVSVTLDWLRDQCFGQDRLLHIRLAEQSGRIVGYAMGFVVFNINAQQRLLDIHHLYVDPAFRRRGLGRDLMNAMAALAQNERCSGVRLGVVRDNRDAQEFYETLGFKPRLDTAIRYRLTF